MRETDLSICISRSEKLQNDAMKRRNRLLQRGDRDVNRFTSIFARIERMETGARERSSRKHRVKPFRSHSGQQEGW